MPLRRKLFICLLIPALIVLAFMAAGPLLVNAIMRVSTSVEPQSLVFAFFAADLFLSIGVAWLLAQALSLNLNAPLDEIRRAADAVAAGNHADRARVSRGDEIGAVAAAVNRMAEELGRGLDERLERLGRVVQDSERLAREIQTAATVILEITGDLTNGSTQQREAVTAASGQAGRLGSAGASIAGNARQIDKLTAESMEACEQGSFVLQGMLTSMEKLRQKTYDSAQHMNELLTQARKVRSVVELIEEISDQVNLIALNAELEAAGAGEAGLRFAVVAEEVTRLAERTLNSTRIVTRTLDSIINSSEIVAKLSETGKEEVDVSLASTEDVGQFLVKLFQRVEKVSKQVQSITVSTEDQLQNANDLTEQLVGIEDLARRMESGVMEVQNSLGLLERISEDLTKQVSGK